MVADDEGVILVELEAFALPVFRIACLPLDVVSCEVLEVEAVTTRDVLRLEGVVWDAAHSEGFMADELAASSLSSLIRLILNEAIARSAEELQASWLASASSSAPYPGCTVRFGTSATLSSMTSSR